MQKNHYLILSVAFMMLSLQSCKKSNTAPSATSTNTISFSFNDTVFSAPSTVSASYSQSQGTMQIVGVYTKPTTIYLTLTGGIKAGPTYNFGSNGGATYSPDYDQKSSYIFKNGSITVKTFTSTIISGTFTALGYDIATDPSVTGYDLIYNAGALTQGKFQVTYTTID